MNNLFIVHTQYNLILATGLVKTAFAEDTNHLILFHDFNLSDTLRDKLNAAFSKFTVIAGNVPKVERTAKEKLAYIKDCNQQIRAFMTVRYDRIFIVDDMCIPEMTALKVAYRGNPAVEMAWLEDGSNAYFPNGAISGGMGATPLKRLIRKVFFSTAFGLGRFYDLGPCMGSHKLLTKGYFTFPQNARAEFADRERIEISDEAFRAGMDSIYGGEPITFDENSVLIAMDKLDVYGDKIDKVNALIGGIVADATAEGKTVYYKYHPRESDRLPALADCRELDKTVGLESYLSRCTTDSLTVVGVMSTALQTAKKMGYETVSLIEQLDSENEAIIQFYKKINVIK